MRLDKYLGNDNKAKMKFAAGIGVSYATLCNWIAGRFKPSMKNLEEIEKFTGGAVKPEDFYQKMKKVKHG